MAISKRLRYEILRRDGHRCKYCGRAAPEVRLTVDHVVPEALGGTDKPDNLVAACSDCNSGKSATPPDAPLVAGVADDQARWALAMNAVVEQRAAELRAQRERLARFDLAWGGYHNSDGEKIPRDVNWKNSVSRFMGFGLDDEFLIDATAVAMGSPKPSHNEVWRYFCGICWREIDDLQARATVALEAAEATPDETLAPLDDRLPYGAGLHPGFDALNRAEAFLVQLIEHVGVDDRDVLVLTTRAFWDGMETAYKTFIGGVGQDWQTWDEELEDRADQAFKDATAGYFAQIRLICQSRQVPDGS